MTERALMQAVKVLLMGYEKITGNTVTSLSIFDDRGGEGDFECNMSFRTEDAALKSRVYKV